MRAEWWTSAPRFCHQCGARRKPAANYCVFCGTVLGTPGVHALQPEIERPRRKVEQLRQALSARQAYEANPRRRPLRMGIALPQIGPQARPENIIKLAKAAEENGFHSLWVLERLLWPLSPKAPYPATPDGRLPQEYQVVFDPVETLAYAAAVTKKIELGTSVIDILFHNPVVLGRRLATLDVLSRGRLVCGFGIGWSPDEYEAAGVAFKDRGARADEFLQVLKAVWTQEDVEFRGKFYTIPPSKIGPKPSRRPHPPILLGGFAPKTFKRIVQFADGWNPALGGSIDELGTGVKRLRDEWGRAGRDPRSLRIVLRAFPRISRTKGKERQPLSGTPDQIKEDLVKVKAIGVDEILFDFNFSPEGRRTGLVIDRMRQLRNLVR